MTAYLDMTEGLAALMDDEGKAMLSPLRGETVYRLTWGDQNGRPREGFASAGTAGAARRICAAHEAGFGRPALAVRARKWGTVRRLGDWLRSRCS